MTKERHSARSTEKDTGSWADSGDTQACAGDTKGTQCRAESCATGSALLSGQFLCTQESFSGILQQGWTDGWKDGGKGTVLRTWHFRHKMLKKNIGIFRIKQCFFIQIISVSDSRHANSDQQVRATLLGMLILSINITVGVWLDSSILVCHLALEYCLTPNEMFWRPCNSFLSFLFGL